jgi:hypothetical protein
VKNDWVVFGCHVLPRDDLRPHVDSECCWCGPTDDEGVWVHHSMDKRELIERGGHDQ